MKSGKSDKSIFKKNEYKIQPKIIPISKIINR